MEVIERKTSGLFPQFGVAENWPPTMFIHGAESSQVLLHESKHQAEKLKSLGVENELRVVQKHVLMSLASDAVRWFGGLFDRAAGFLVQNLRK